MSYILSEPDSHPRYGDRVWCPTFSHEPYTVAAAGTYSDPSNPARYRVTVLSLTGAAIESELFHWEFYPAPDDTVVVALGALLVTPAMQLRFGLNVPRPTRDGSGSAQLQWPKWVCQSFQVIQIQGRGAVIRGPDDRDHRFPVSCLRVLSFRYPVPSLPHPIP